MANSAAAPIIELAKNFTFFLLSCPFPAKAFAALEPTHVQSRPEHD